MLTSHPDDYAAEQAVVEAKICSCIGVRREPSKDTQISYGYVFTDPLGETAKPWLFFIPHPLAGDGYTQAQLSEIERILAAIGVDLLPLDPHLVRH